MVYRFLLALLIALFAVQAPTTAQQKPIKVELRTVDGRYQLYRGGQPYYIKGAGGSGRLELLAAHGGNSIRTWSTRGADAILDKAQELGLTVTLGLDVARERHGFDYNDAAAVARQRETIRQEILKYRNHPALIAWAIGNELNLNATNPKVWDAVNDISRMIHELDPNHLTTTTLAGINPTLLQEVNRRATDLDLLSIQMYAGIVTLPKFIQETGMNRPYMVTEWGATGHWEVAKTPWDVAIEDNSSVKADNYLKRYNAVIASDRTLCVGSYVFLWGQKQERTPTWYGIFLKSGEETESVDVMHYIWSGRWPSNRTPRLESARLDGKTAYDGIRVKAGGSYPVEVAAKDPEGDRLTYQWDLKPESTDLKEGGDAESVPESIPGRVTAVDQPKATLRVPEKPGAYRLFVYVFDGKGHAAHANIPFLAE